MANGLLAPLPPTGSPLETSLMQNQQQPTPDQLEAGLLGGGQPTQPQAGDMSRLNQIYGLLAQYGDDPTRVGLQYAQALQEQQAQAYQASPEARMQQFLGMMGNINPYDITPQSIQKFYDSFMQGDVNFDLLEYRERLTDTETKEIVKAQDEAEQALSAMEMGRDMAAKFDELHRRGESAGIIANVEEWLATQLGRQGEAQQVRDEYRRFINKEIIQNLPPGVASDRDIMIAKEGWPPATASPAYVAAFLRGRQKMLAIQHAYARHKEHYIGKNRSVVGRGEDWFKKRRQMAVQALQEYGGLYIPRDAQGNELSPEQAAELYYTRQQMGPSVAIGERAPLMTPQGAAPAPAAPAATPTEARRQQALERWAQPR